jgi:hypothetical protein
MNSSNYLLKILVPPSPFIITLGFGVVYDEVIVDSSSALILKIVSEPHSSTFPFNVIVLGE